MDIFKFYVMFDVHETVRQIAEPIDNAYTTAEGGLISVREERTARCHMGIDDCAFRNRHSRCGALKRTLTSSRRDKDAQQEARQSCGGGQGTSGSRPPGQQTSGFKAMGILI